MFSLLYVGCWVILPGGGQALREVTGLARDLRPGRGTGPTLVGQG